MLSKAEFASPHLADRRANVASALASFAIEGLEPDRQTAEILDHYAAGRITLEEIGEAIQRHVMQMDANESISGAA